MKNEMMIFKKNLIALVICLLFNQIAFAATQSLNDALDALNKSIDKGLSRSVDSNRIGIMGVLYDRKHTELSQTIESSLEEYFTKNRNFDIFNRSKLMEIVKDELQLQNTDFYFNKLEAVQVGRFSPVDVLIMGTIREKEGNIVIKVISMEVKTLKQFVKEVTIKYNSWFDDYLNLSNEQKEIDKERQQKENERENERQKKQEIEDEKRKTERSNRQRDQRNALSDRRNKKKKVRKCIRKCKQKGYDSYKCNQLCG